MCPDFQSLEDQLRKTLSRERFAHTVGVQRAAASLAARWGADVQKAKLAGLLHDCARGYSAPQLIQMAAQTGVCLTEFEKRNSVLVHAPLGAQLARSRYGVEDPEVLRAIRYHTTACGDMDMLSKIVYLADYISPERTFPGVEEIRRWAERDMRRALVSATRSSLTYLLSREVGVHPDTLEFWNSLVR